MAAFDKNGPLIGQNVLLPLQLLPFRDRRNEQKNQNQQKEANHLGADLFHIRHIGTDKPKDHHGTYQPLSQNHTAVKP